MKPNSRIFLWSLIVALGGFLFGFDTAVISGVEQSIKKVFDLSPLTHGFAISSALIGTVLGALFAGRPADQWGRKPILYIIAAGYAISAIGTALAPDLLLFILFRFLGGIAVGASSVVAPMYISEIAPAHMRGKATASFQVNVIVGILMAFISNYLLRDLGVDAWRWMLGILFFPSVLYLILLSIVPESPRFLISKGQTDLAQVILSRIGSQIEDHALSIVDGHSDITEDRLFSRRYIKPLMIAFLIAAFNQFSGINAILYFAPRIFELSGVSMGGAFFQPVIIGLTNAIFTLVGLVLVDRVGRRPLLFIGSSGMSICLAIVAVIYFGQSYSPWLLAALVGYIVFFAISTGTVIWIIISEVFPVSVRGKGQSFGSFVHWFFAALITFIFPVVLSSYVFGAAWMFVFFAVMMVLQALFAYFYLPETKGRSLEEISRELEM
ncbi:sugar porter family MFS transporter [Sphingobacterium faecale]|uniref:Sugar porter family MFS transporter n=1 Tax=Sphingobacterium faecale TaxID=2803775 RepID=A0ABS1RB59_9SPHI|nr:sugar porter family MFS transporter [Sphingobacterium faecale]MBL1411459.1 sugar porter family MFS transporter [Sphingobacterium faecale]